MNASLPSHNNTPHMSLVLGGVRSGKSQFAEKLASSFGNSILYIATAQILPGPGSMEYRIRKHRERRPAQWITLEQSHNIAAALLQNNLLNQVNGVILECMTLLTSNILYAQPNPTLFEPFLSALKKELAALQSCIKQSPVPWVIVSSETGMGVSQSDPETRHYCDGLGIANQILAQHADKVYLMVAGIPLTVK